MRIQESYHHQKTEVLSSAEVALALHRRKHRCTQDAEIISRVNAGVSVDTDWQLSAVLSLLVALIGVVAYVFK